MMRAGSLKRSGAEQSKPRVSTGNPGGAQWRDLRSAVLSWKCFSTEESWAFGPPKVMKNGSRSLEPQSLPLVIPTGAQRSGGTCGSAALSWKCFSTERTRISYFAKPATTTYAALLRESRTQSINATVLDRKYGERSGGICGFFSSVLTTLFSPSSAASCAGEQGCHV
jgi:hypothetical protein